MERVSKFMDENIYPNEEKIAAEIAEGDRWQPSQILEGIKAKAKSEGHPAPFPEELPRRLIKLHSFYGDYVLDPFLGTGTTAKVAQELGRKGRIFSIG